MSAHQKTARNNKKNQEEKPRVSSHTHTHIRRRIPVLYSFTLNGEPRYHPSSSKELSFVVSDEGVAFSWLLATTPRDALRLLDEVAAFSWLLATTPRDALRLLGEVATFSWLFAKNENSELSYKGKLRVPLSHPPFLPSLI